jgi:hypothetical protein
MIRRETLMETAKDILELASHYKGAPHREMLLDGLVYGVLNAKFGVSRQHHVRSSVAGGKPKRIDFRQGGTNPVVIEFVVRTARHRNEAYGGQNKDELHKLARQSRAKARYLLILDIVADPIQAGKLRASYAKVNHQRGRGSRMRVRVLYAHSSLDYHFLWPVTP